MKIRNIINVAAAAALTFSTVAAVPTFEAVSKQNVAEAATPKRHIAMKFNYSQRGDWYCYGGNGPSCWDCSGLVKKSYGKAGIWLPRTTGQMQWHWRLKRTYKPRWGDIVFLSANHVEMYVQKGWMHGAHRTGTRVGYRKIYNGPGSYPRYYRVYGAG